MSASSQIHFTPEMMSQLMNINIDAVIAINQAQCMVYVNHSTEKTFGYTEKELIGQSIDMLLPQRFRNHHHQHIQLFADSPETSRAMGDRKEIMGVRRDGTEFPAQAGISKISQNGEPIFMVILQDISERVALETQARESFIKSAILDERNRLSRELHDTVTQTLFTTTVIANILPQLWEKNPNQGREQLNQIRKLTNNALSEMRMLMMELRPDAIVDASLKELIRHLVNAATNRSDVAITLDIQEHNKLSPEVHVALYRILQESLINLVRHLGCKHISLNLQTLPKKALLLIHLDGKPLELAPTNIGETPPNEVMRAIQVIRKQADSIGATVTIGSDSGDDSEMGQTNENNGNDIFIEWSEPR